MLTFLRVKGAGWLRHLSWRAACLWLVSIVREVAVGVVAIFGGYNRMSFSLKFLHFLPVVLLSFLLLLTACGQGSSTTTTTSGSVPAQATATPALDAYGTPIVAPTTAPQRIVSLVPSMSEILGSLNLQDRVVGVDYYTDYPAALASKKKVSDANGAFTVETIVALKPDLILSWGGQTKTIDGELAKLGLHIVDLPTVNFSQLLPQIRLVGQLTKTESVAASLTAQLQQQIDQVKAKVVGTSVAKVLLEVDDSTPGKPYVFGGTSFGDELLQDANASNIFHENTTNGGYPQVSDESVIAANPQYVILTEDPQYGGNASAVYKRPNWGSIDAVKMHHVYHLNTDLLQRPDPRLVEGLLCVAQVVHPDKFPGPFPAYCEVNS
jgi:iron complex transport system substrate-binding protein